ncbi:MAG: 16S rRNA (cytosine(1402)-N(4))-methyltransferase [Candidatus Doudnabacteria bacterium CG10_big_fil_rev_8_21_14_0_10_41_10]|uniref:Ribosomal RNA small subunit methyltransferase H n=1 Tax=Candidatus Doudnabacteria bacterium CG10_big_fil_rev_8_21_14_0_10_41_10 TaxID=1974551 RepID=A0A2H0VEG2_9BACT|nr:MAG: 16S rRNA (cytosine(1402)-N(4))-methyltransferase [Candidatus Doudnabacteria bacterium CG10_big_fil_rev_8_21_14_0_10_41_10]
MIHISVLLKETIDFLNPKPGGKFIDATFGAGGHSKRLIEKVQPGGEVLGIDANLSAVGDFRIKNKELRIRGLKLVHGNFRDIGELAKQNGFEQVDGILFDLGLSSDMLDNAQRGFSFQKNGPLDMRFDQTQKITAEYILKNYEDKRLVKIFKEYGEEKFSKKIAKAIVVTRKQTPLTTTEELLDIIKRSLPARFRHKAGDSARRIFQALRIEVNQELESLEKVLPQTLDLLKSKGRLVVISFHSLEDRMVKQFFKNQANPCVCPPDFPECVCGKISTLKIVTKKPVIVSEKEALENSRSLPAKLRAAEKV